MTILPIDQAPEQGVTHAFRNRSWLPFLMVTLVMAGITAYVAIPKGDAGQAVYIAVPGFTTCVLAGMLAARLRLDSVATRVADATAPLEAVPVGGYDRVLVDAPCSNTGTLRRHPERRWKIEPDALDVLGRLQGALLDNAAGAVRPGGVLVFAVCSILREEAEAVTEGFLADHADFTIEPPVDREDLSWQPLLTAEGAVRTWPHRHEMDGFYAVRYRRRES